MVQGTRRTKRRSLVIPRSWQYVGLGALTVFVGALVVTAFQPERVVADPTYTRQAQPSPTVVLADPTVVFIGDSYVGGSDMGGNDDKNWTELASASAGWRACSFAVGGSGWTRGSNDWTFGSRVQWALSRNPSLVVFANAVNDLKDPAGVAASAEAALATLRAKNADVPVLIVGPARVTPAQSPAIDTMDEQLHVVANKYGAMYMSPTAEGWFDGAAASYLGSDRFHPTDEGHAYYAQRFLDDAAALGVQLSKVPKDERAPCTVPSWGNVRPDGSVVKNTPSPTSTDTSDKAP